MAAAAAPWILQGLLGSRAAGGLWRGLRPLEGMNVFKRNPFAGPRRDIPRGAKPYWYGGKSRPISVGGIKGTAKSLPGPVIGGSAMGRLLGGPGGLFYRNPKKTVWGALLGGPAAAGTAYGLLSGDDKPDEATGPSRADLMRKREQAESDALAAKQPSMSAGHRTDYLKKRRKRLQKGMKQLLNQYMILCAVAPDECDNFLKSGMKMMETDQEFNDDLQMQDAYDTVFQPGNMPTSGRDAFAKLLPYVGKKDAMAIAGDWSDLVPDYKEHQYMTKQRMEMRDVVALDNAGDRPGAIAMLIRGWQSGSFKTRPDHLVIGQSNKEDWIKAANEAIDLMTTGSATAGTGGTNWAVSDEMS